MAIAGQSSMEDEMGSEFIHGTTPGASSPNMARAFSLDAINATLDQLAFYIGADAPNFSDGRVRRSLAIRALWLLCRELEPDKMILEGCELFSVHGELWIFLDLTFNPHGWTPPAPSKSQWQKRQLPFKVTRTKAQFTLVRSEQIGEPSPIETVVRYANEYLMRHGVCSIDGGPLLPEKPPL